MARARSTRFKWTAARDRLLGAMRDCDVATKLGIAHATARRRRLQLGIPSFRLASANLPAVDQLLGKIADVDIAAACSVSVAVVRRRRTALGELRGKPIASPPAVPRRHSLDDAKLAAKLRGGRCLSSRTGTMLRWRCAQGHEWEQTAYKIIRCKQWCGRCAGQIRD